MMHSRREFLRKTSMASMMLATIPQIFTPTNVAAKSRVYKNLKPLNNLSNSTLSENIVFNRASSATYYESNGLLTYAQQNLFTYSQDFTNLNWAKTGITVGPSAVIAAPDGTFTAGMVKVLNVSGEHKIGKSIDVSQGIMHTCSIYLKAGACTKVRVAFSNDESYTGGSPRFNINLSNGVISSKTSNVISCSVNNAGNKWWRIVFTATPDLGSLSGLSLFMLNNLEESVYAESTWMYIWGAQFESAPVASLYYPTANVTYSAPRYNYDPNTLSLKGLMIEPASTNMLKKSIKLNDTSIWLYRNVLLQPETVLSPDGVSRAVKLMEDGLSNSHYIRPAIKPAVVQGQQYTFSVFVKAGERKWMYFNLEGATIHFDLNDGTVSRSVNPAFQSANVEIIGNGWYRISATLFAAGSVMDTSIGVEVTENVRVYKGDGVSGIYVWGPQLETGSYASSYIPTDTKPATRSTETCSLLAPPTSSVNDIMIQRTNGGMWVNNISDNYNIPNSRYELLTGSFWEAGVPAGQKEEIAENMFPPDYINAGFSTAKVNLFGTDYRVQSPNKEYSVSLAKNKTCQLYKFQLNSGDQWSSDAGKDKERSELYSLTKMPFDQDVWLSYAVRVAPGAPVSSAFCHLGQFHATEDSGEVASVPVLTFRFKGENALQITTCANTEKIAKVNTTGVIRYNGTLQRGVWVRNVMRIRFSPTNGQLQWWENGVEKLNLSGVGIGNNDTVGPYWKFGIYRTRSVETLIAEYANMELSTTTSLISRVTEPLLIS
ncbi:heparin lyase I family protein [Dyadobacter sp. NIV53]|uniref:phage head spike fiber domain-containing protein n=1 Tax=Dyadobacter sp. NIV53 TaxID=2861765 RepID=UPI001C8850D8|nr:heparin lyase I family protein [Dyadobacter sp. NIV53]